MAQSVQNFASQVDTYSSGANSFALTLGAGTNRKVVISFPFESSVISLSNIAYNGQAATLVEELVYSGGTLKISTYYVDVPDGTSAGSYNVTFTASALTNGTCMAWQTVNSATGAPEATDSGETTGTTGVSGAGMSVSAGSLTLATFNASAATPTYSAYGGGITERQQNNETNFTSAAADAVQASAGTVTCTATLTSTSGNHLVYAVSIAEVASATGAKGRMLLMGVG